MRSIACFVTQNSSSLQASIRKETSVKFRLKLLVVEEEMEAVAVVDAVEDAVAEAMELEAAEEVEEVAVMAEDKEVMTTESIGASYLEGLI